jgi:hypothetical protein
MRVQFVGLGRIVSGAFPRGAWRIKHGVVSKRLSSSAGIEVYSDDNTVEQGEVFGFAERPSLNLIRMSIIDGRLLRAAANFSRLGETRQDNDLVALRGANVCAGFEAKFDRAWARG